MKEKAYLLDSIGVERVITRLAHEILEKNHGTKDLVLIGIKTRGDLIAKRLGSKIKETEKVELPVGALDISFYRDDTQSKPLRSTAKTTEIPFDIEGKKVILVDDVLYTGRSIRAAIDELVDFGRPAAVQLVVLVDRGHRELPIHADYVGKNVPTARTEEISVMLKEMDGEDKVVILSPEEKK